MLSLEEDWELLSGPSIEEPTINHRITRHIGSLLFTVIPIPGRNFSMMETPVTQELYQEILGENPSWFLNKPQNPVDCVSWVEAEYFCTMLSERTQSNFRLPTLEEWEFSALGGLSSFEYFTPLGNYAFFDRGVGTVPVKSKLPNGYGLYDVLGNVWEWTSTSSLFYGRNKSICGGSYEDVASDYDMRSLEPTFRFDRSRSATIGFRCLEDFSG